MYAKHCRNQGMVYTGVKVPEMNIIGNVTAVTAVVADSESFA